MLKRLIAFVALVMILTACGGQATATVAPAAPVAAAATPEEVHTAFVAAMRAADRPAALALVDETKINATTVDEWIEQIESNLTSGRMGPDELIDVKPIRVWDIGTKKWGSSLWSYTHSRNICYKAELQIGELGWRVISWSPTLGERCSRTT